MKALLATHLLCTLGMFGVIWIVQVVHYPLFDRADRDSFAAFEASHSNRITWIVGPLMLGEVATAGLLAVRLQSDDSAWIWWTGLALVIAIWASTALLSMPEHNRLSVGWDASAYRRLVLTNWPRTILWTARSLLVLYGTFRLLEPAAKLAD